MSPSLMILPTGVANLASVDAALDRARARRGLGRAFAGRSLEAEACPWPRATRPEEVRDADGLVVPGVGAFAPAMRGLEERRLATPLVERIRAGRPTLLVCLGMQLLATASEEAPGVPGLGVIASTVRAFPEGVRSPQMGWNRVGSDDAAELLAAGDFYFANGYRMTTVPEGWRAARADHGGPFVAALERGAVLACQFHPEISGRDGAALLDRWLGTVGRSVSC